MQACSGRRISDEYAMEGTADFARDLAAFLVHSDDALLRLFELMSRFCFFAGRSTRAEICVKKCRAAAYKPTSHMCNCPLDSTRESIKCSMGERSTVEQFTVDLSTPTTHLRPGA